MVDRRYLLDQPPPPAGLAAVFNQKVLPVLVNAAGGVEGGLEKVASTVRRAPNTSLLIAVGVGFLLAQAGRLHDA